MNFTYPKPPLQMIDNIPAYKAGEWEGSKSNKFNRVRKPIKAVDKEEVLLGCDYFNQNPRKKHFNISNSSEATFKPCMKIFKQAYISTNNNTNKEALIRPQSKKESEINLELKKHYFEYRDEYIKNCNIKSKKMENKVIIQDELNYLSKIGLMIEKKNLADHIEKSKTKAYYNTKDKFSIQNIYNINNNIDQIDYNNQELNNLSEKTKNELIIKDILEKNKHIDPLFLIHKMPNRHKYYNKESSCSLKNKDKKIDNNVHEYLLKKKQQALDIMKYQIEMIKKDVDYVKDLKNWEYYHVENNKYKSSNIIKESKNEYDNFT